MNLSSYGRDIGTLYKQEFGNGAWHSRCPLREPCPGGRAAGDCGDWQFRTSVSWGSAWDVSQGKNFRGWVLKNCVQSLKTHRPRCWQGRWCDPQDTGRAEQDAAARHPPPWALAAFNYCLVPASSQEISGRETSVLGRSPKPPLAWE